MRPIRDICQKTRILFRWIDCVWSPERLLRRSRTVRNCINIVREKKLLIKMPRQAVSNRRWVMWVIFDYIIFCTMIFRCTISSFLRSSEYYITSDQKYWWPLQFMSFRNGRKIKVVFLFPCERNCNLGNSKIMTVYQMSPWQILGVLILITNFTRVKRT